MSKGKYKKGDIITDYDCNNDHWHIWEVIHLYNNESGIYYWIECIYYENGNDNSIASAMDIHSEDYMNLVNIRKLKDDDEPKLLAKIL